MMIETDVLIVGGGPVGLALAADLGWRGVKCHLVEQTDGAIVQPKMDGVNIRTMEFCRRWNIAEQVLSCGYPPYFPQDMVYLTSFDGYELGREEFITPSGGGEERLRGSSPETRFRCPQNLFDPILRQLAESFQSVRLLYRTRLTGFEDSGDRVHTQIEDLETNQVQACTAHYLVGCDGASSFVRRALGIKMSGRGVLSYTTNVVFRTEDLALHHRIRLGYRHIFIGPEGTWATLVAINGQDQWRLSLIGGSERRVLTEAEIIHHIKRAIGQKVAFDILTIVPWTRRELVADTFRVGNVFLAGDAAHIMSPTGGFGMNTGVADAVDLSWKIEAMLTGWGGPALLGSYEAERRPIALRVTREATGNLHRTLSPGTNPNLLQPGIEGALVRYRVGARYSATMLREWYKLGIDLGYIYRGSPIIGRDDAVPRDFALETSPPPDGYLADGTPITPALLREWQRLGIHLALGDRSCGEPGEDPPHEVMTYLQSAEPGARAPHVWLEPDRSTLDLFGRSFVLLNVNGNESDGAALLDAAKQTGVPLRQVCVSGAAIEQAYGARLVLVRPDGHVAWRGEAVSPPVARSIIDLVCGRSQ